MSKIKITKKEFLKYETVRKLGKTNMFDIKMVEKLSGLNRKKIIYIMEKYSDLDNEYGDMNDE